MSSNPNQALWEKGDFTRIAQAMRAAGDALVASLDVGPGLSVLDLGCGDGTTALPAARRGANVLGVDIARNLVAAGNARVQAEGLANCSFRHGDASRLEGIADDSFDLVVTVFGAMFAPRPMDVAAEMVRVARPGGRIVMGNWIPNDSTVVAQILRISSAYAPPPPEGFVSPMTWGVPAHVVERFGAAGLPAERISCTPANYRFDYDVPPAQVVELFRDYYGPSMNAFAAAHANGKAADLQRELTELFERLNVSPKPETTRFDATFLQVIVSV